MQKHASTMLYRGQRQCLFYEADHVVSLVVYGIELFVQYMSKVPPEGVGLKLPKHVPIAKDR